MKGPTVFIVDDDPGVRNSIRELVISVGLAAETFDSAQSFLDDLDSTRPGCLVLDVRMARMSGFTLEAELGKMGVDIPIVFISGHGDISMAVNAVKRGAVDFVPKPYKEQHLLDAINEGLRRDSLARSVPVKHSTFAELSQLLTPREHEVLEHALEGQSCKEIARVLGISHRTVERHRSHLLEKLGVASITELLRLKFSASDSTDKLTR